MESQPDKPIEQPKPKKKRVMPKLQIVESHAEPEGGQLRQELSQLPQAEKSEFILLDKLPDQKPKKKPETHLDGSVQSMTSISTIPIQKNQINIEKEMSLMAPTISDKFYLSGTFKEEDGAEAIPSGSASGATIQKIPQRIVVTGGAGVQGKVHITKLTRSQIQPASAKLDESQQIHPKADQLQLEKLDLQSTVVHVTSKEEQKVDKGESSTSTGALSYKQKRNKFNHSSTAELPISMPGPNSQQLQHDFNLRRAFSLTWLYALGHVPQKPDRSHLLQQTNMNLCSLCIIILEKVYNILVTSRQPTLTLELAAQTKICSVPRDYLCLIIICHLFISNQDEQPSSENGAGEIDDDDLTQIKGNKQLSVEVQLSDLIRYGALGQGASGYVEKAVHKPTKKIIALKVIPLQSNEKVKKQILLELKTLHQCECENIVRSYGAFLKDGQVHIALEYMDAGSLASVIKEVGKIPEQIIGLMTVQMLKGLEYLHKTMKVIHRDIKPSNILLNKKGSVKIADFGVSGQMDSTFDCKSSWVGTVSYMSPERLKGESYFSDTDIWSLGLLLVECALGKFPYPYEDDPEGVKELGFWELMKYITLKDTPKLPEDKFSADFRDFISRCLRKQGGTRLSASELLKHPFSAKYEKVDQRHLKKWIRTIN